MTTNFALSLSSDGISLLHRVQRGWRIIGTASVDDPDLGDALAQMRDKALGIDPGGLRTKLVIPLDQIKYIAIDSTLTDLNDIHAALDGATPYGLDELVIDFERSGGRTHIAAVARETLDEAESFARAHGFNPVCFVAVPEPFTFQAEVFFGPTAMMTDVLGPGGVVERDALPVLVVGTRIKSRLLVFDQDVAVGKDDLDLTALLSRGGIHVPDDDDSLTPLDAAPNSAIGDLFATTDDNGPPAQNTPASTGPLVTPPEPVRIDAVIAEYHSPAASSETEGNPSADLPAPVAPENTAEAVSANRLPLDASSGQIDRIIPEYRPDQPGNARNAAQPVPLVAERPKAPHRVNREPAMAAPSRKPLVAAAAVVAVIAATAWAIWPVDGPQVTVAPPVVSDTPEIAQTTQTQTTSSLPAADVASGIAWQVDAALTPTPQTPMLSLATPGMFSAPLQNGTPVLADVADPDAPISGVARPPPPPAPEGAAATSDAPVLRGQILTPDEAAGVYAATGVWQRAPRISSTPRTTSAVGITRPTAVTTPPRIVQTAFPAEAADPTDQSFLAPADPPPPDVVFPIDEDGFILATPDGTLTPEGAIVVAGLPDIQVRPRPELSADDLARMAALAPAPDGVIIVPGPPAVQPPVRPDDLAPTSISAGGVALTGLVSGNGGDAETDPQTAETGQPALRPRLRPAAIVPQAQAATAPDNPDITSVIAGLETVGTATPFIDMTPSAVGVSTRPVLRPNNFDRVVEIARSRQPAAPTAPDTREPDDEPSFEMTLPQSTAPIPGGVARAATEDDVIPLRDINLIGIYGRSNARRALVRLSNGRYVRVEVGSALDGGQVTAIGESALNYVKRGRTLTLELPTG